MQAKINQELCVRCRYCHRNGRGRPKGRGDPVKVMDRSKQDHVLPKNLVRIGKPRALSEAQLRHLRELQCKV